MFSTTIYNNIFKANIQGQDMAETYSRSGQDDVGLEWLGRLSLRLAHYVAYLRVVQSAEDACLFVNEQVDLLLTELSSSNVFPDRDSDVITVETMQALRFLMEEVPTAQDHFINQIAQEIECGQASKEAEFLRPLGSF